MNEKKTWTPKYSLIQLKIFKFPYSLVETGGKGGQVLLYLLSPPEPSELRDTQLHFSYVLSSFELLGCLGFESLQSSR